MMWEVVGLLGGIAGLAVPVLVIVLVVRAARRQGERSAVPGAPVRRFFQYGLMFAGLVLAANGIDALGRAAFEADSIARGPARVATPLALIVVGVPLFLGIASSTRSRMAEDADEQRSLGWLLYLTLALLVSLAVAFVAASGAIGAAIGAPDAQGSAWVTAVVWAAVWGGHWWASLRRVPADDSRSHRLLGSIVGLWSSVAFVIALGGAVLTWAYRELFSTTLVATVGDTVRSLVGPLVVSLAILWWYWFRHSRRQRPVTIGWNAYVLLGGVLGGLVVTVVALGSMVFVTLVWFLGDAGAEGAAAHFELLPGALLAALVGTGSWRYHRHVLRGAGSTDAEEVGRAYTYLLAALGLLAAAAGLTVLLVAAAEAVAAPTRLVIVATANVAVAGLTLLLVGVPLWWAAWSSVGAPGRDEATERASISRRLYLSASFGLGGVVAVVSLVVVVAAFFEDLIGGTLGRETLYEIRVALALVITVGAVASYHWRVFRADRALAPVVGRPFDRLLVVAGGDGEALGRAVAERTGARVDVWQAAEGGAGVATAEQVAEALRSMGGREGVVIVDLDGTARVIEARRV